jgi:D-beta-D-heptose 7-phosphate kinase/D-beta-D-heptose 1-phosphate adenosyltransferase
VSGGLLAGLDRFEGIRVVVLGEAILDSYLSGFASGLCREAPVPIINLNDRRNVPGGAANTAANASALGGAVTFLSVVGADDESTYLKGSLVERGVKTSYLIEDRDRRTLTKNRLVSDSQILIRFDHGTAGPLNLETEELLIDRLEGALTECDVLIISDYDTGLFSPRILRGIEALRPRFRGLTVVDAKTVSRYRRIQPHAIKPNYAEAVRLLRLPALELGEDRAGQLTAAGERLLEMSGAEIAAVTLDIDGSLLLERGTPPYRTYSRPVTNSRALGAGDTYTATLALALASGSPAHAAAELASSAASVVIEKEGTSVCSALELRERLFAQHKYTADLDELAQRVELYRNQDRQIVFTNGCFDLIHVGHIAHLVEAKALGDVLIVGVNSDESVTRLKGPGRPITTLEDRVEVLSALSCIDHIISFEEDTPARLIEIIRPDAFVKGGDYTLETIPEAELVKRLDGQVYVLPYIDGRSTSRIIQRIGEAYEHGGNSVAVPPPAS